MLAFEWYNKMKLKEYSGVHNSLKPDVNYLILVHV